MSGLDHSLNPFGKRVPLVGVGGRTRTLGYVLIRVQVEGVPGYDEDQVAFVVDDPTTTFGIRVPIVLGTPTINRVIAIMKESDLHNAPHEWQACRASHDAAQGFMMRRVSLDPGERFPTNTGEDPIDLDETVRLTTKCIVPGFQTVVVHGRTEETMMIGEQRLHVLTQAPYPDDRAGLPNGVYITRMYTDLEPGSRRVAVVVRNMTSRPIHLAKGRVQAANLVPEATPSPELLKKLGADSPAVDKPQMTVKERQEALLAALKKDGGLDRLKDWPPALAAKAVRLLLEFHYIFSLEPNEIGCTDLTEHTIELLNDEPFKERFRRIAPPVVEEVRAHIQEMLDGGAIQPSQSPWCNAVVLVRKKDGSLRFCIDFCRLNQMTKKDAFPLPRMQETMESMVGARHFSCMDLKSGFWQVKMDEKSRQYTAFTVGSMGVYEFLHMPYGLCNAPATFQRLMQNCLGELNLSYALIYLDDVIVYSHMEEEHLTHQRALFERLLESGLKLKPSKCHFFRTEISYLGHKVSASGMEPGTEGVKAIAEMAPPKTYTAICQFLGATGYFRRFIKGYAKIAKPLNYILSGSNSKLKGCFVRLPPLAVAAFQELKMKCMTAPVLAFADFKKEFQLETDVSGDGLGAVLSQRQEDGLLHPVAFASRGLKGGEARYHSSKLEFLALKWAITDQFREYLQYAPFKVKTDNNPLTYVMTTPNLDAVGHRWVSVLAGYNFTIEYLRGSDNKVADALSRVEERLDSDSVHQLLAHVNHPAEARAEVADPRLAEEHERTEQEIILQVRQLADTQQQMKNLADSHWVIAQQNEPAIKLTYQWLKHPKNDHRTLGEFLQGRVPQNHTARTTARVLYNEYFSVFGFPRRLMSDQAPEFSGRVIAAMCDLLGVSKVRTSPYHPQSNGVVERAHQTLRHMIGKIDPEKRSKWPSHLGSVIIAYNATRSLVTGFSPYFLMFGQRPRLPIDLLFPTAIWQETSRTVDEYVLSLYERLKEALPVARDSAKLEAQRQKRHYDRRAGAVELQPGDKVLIKLDAFRGQHRKLKNHWSGELHTVVNRVVDGVPTYVVTGDKTGKRQVLHRAWLLLWQAEFDGEPLRVNCILIDSSLPGTDLKTQPWRGGRTNAVPRSLVYGLNMTLLQSQQESSDPKAGYLAQGALTGMPRNGTGYRIPEVGKRI